MCYFSAAINPKERKRAVEWLLKQLKDIEFDAIAVRGSSGLTMGSIIAHEMSKHLMVIRKENDGSHSGYMVEEVLTKYSGNEPIRYIIIDDCVESGQTVKEILMTLSKYFHRRCCSHLLKGLFLYQNDQTQKEMRRKLHGIGIESAKNSKKFLIKSLRG